MALFALYLKRMYFCNFLQHTFTVLLAQDEGLEMIAEGLDTLKNMAHDMNEV